MSKELLQHREVILQAEISRLNNERTYSVDEVRAMLKEKYRNADHSSVARPLNSGRT